MEIAEKNNERIIQHVIGKSNYKHNHIMNFWLTIDLLVFVLVLLLTGVLIPQILMIAFRKNLLDIPDPRKIHTTSVPRLGGIAFFPAVLFSIMLMFGICRQFRPEDINLLLGSSVTGVCFLTCAAVILYLVGMADDLVGVKYRAKFVAQIFAAVLCLLGSIQLNDLHGFLGINTMPTVVAIALSMLLTVFITNSINLIDGIDGLASGLSAIAVALYGYIFIKAELHIFGMLSFATLGALIPFYYYNVFGDATKHGKIFMGDTGALTIGLILSVLSIRICSIPDSVLQLNPVAVAFSPLLIPCCDVVRVYLHRIKAHRNPFMPDKTHIHHKLLALGLPQRIAMLVIVATSLALSLLNYYLCQHINITVLFFLDLALWIISNRIISLAIRRREITLGKILYQ